MKTYLRFKKKPSFFSLNFPAAHDVMFHSISTTPSLPHPQNPEAADKLAKIQRDLDETKVILHKTIESVLDRGEKLDQVCGGWGVLTCRFILAAPPPCLPGALP